MNRISNRQTALKPQDLMVVLKLFVSSGKSTTYSELGETLGMSPSEVHASVGRATSSHLMSIRDERPVVVKAALTEFLLHGAKYAFPVTLGSPTRGVPTGYAAAPLVARISQPNELPPVWPDPHGERRGIAFYPLYPTAPFAARKDHALYELLALFDALRGGAARERQLATQLLSERLS
jgi:hypothetical protein